MSLIAEAVPAWGWTALAVALGPAIGSFIGLVSRRWPQGRPIAVGRSACEGCGRPLAVVDLVPVVSFAVLGGRCRTCRAPIARRYFALEVACALLPLWAGLVHPGPQALVGAVLAWQLVLLALLDAEHFWLPRAATLTLAATGLAFSALAGLDDAISSLIGGAAGYLALAVTAALYRRVRHRDGLGAGDAYMLAGAGTWVGWIGVPTTLLWAGLAGLSLVAAGLIAGRRMKADHRLPFGVFLAAGAWLTWLYGPLGGFRPG